jgi:FAD/FMN-containing dehydrogenase
MQRRQWLKVAAMAAILPGILRRGISPALARATAPVRSRVRPGDPAWPSAADWERLNREVGGRLLKPNSPFADCAAAPDDPACGEALRQIKNPYYLGDQPALTQTSGWVDAWTSQPSAYAVAAESTADVVAALKFARAHHLRLVVKGGGHSYQGTSAAADSLLMWTRRMNEVTLHDAFVARGCDGKSPQPAVSVGAGAMWIDAYNAVTTLGGRYVQGGGCMTVGVAGLIQSGGFGSFSKNYGTASAGLLEAEIVTADGEVRIANACTHPDLFWGIKGGGGGSLGVITRLTLRTRELPEYFGGVFGSIRATSDAAYQGLIAKAIAFYASDLFNPHWGEQMIFQTDNTLRVAMVFQGLNQQEAQVVWAPFVDWVRAQPECSFLSELTVLSLPARHFWDADFLTQHAPSLVTADDRPGALKDHILWAGDQGQVGWFLHGYKSAWLPASLLAKDRQSALVDAVFSSTRQWQMAFHFNKGLAGAPASEIDAARDTATHPALLEAFALAIIAAEGPPAFPGMPGPKPDLAAARADAIRIGKAMDELLRVAPNAGSYVAESDYFEPAWQRSFWGQNYQKLMRVKQKYDPEGLFFVHHGVGSEAWSADGFTRRDAV